MITWHSKTEIFAGPGAALEYCLALTRQELASATVFVDAELCELQPISELMQALNIDGERLVPVAPGTDTLHDLTRCADQIRAAGSDGRVLAIGGGLVIDTARLASVIASTDARRLPHLLNPGRSGLVLLAPKGVDARRVTAFTTTLGTGAEVSPVACLHHDPAKRIVLGEVLKADVAVIDPALTASLPHRLVEQGIIEVILRFAGPYLAGPSQLGIADTVALDELTALGALLSRARAGGLESADRLEVSLRSANTRIGWGLIGRAPCASKLWYLATALTDCAAIDKVPANLALLPTVLGQIAAGDRRFGLAERIVDVDRALQPRPETLVYSPAQSAANIVAFLRQRQTSAPELSVTADVVGSHADRYWGSGQAMLGELTKTELTQLYANVLTPRLIATSM